MACFKVFGTGGIFPDFADVIGSVDVLFLGFPFTDAFGGAPGAVKDECPKSPCMTWLSCLVGNEPWCITSCAE